MIYRTLHVYILRELLRVFLLTASALTTLLAFGGMFKPLTKQGIDVSQVMILMFSLMPAMLAYAIPIAALFAAVLVYWRMSTDNELTACRAGGVSFTAIVLPAFALGVAVASVDLVFVNYVVPHYLQVTERAVRKDLGSWIVSQVERQERFQYEALPLVVAADSAEQIESSDPNETTVVLRGMAAEFFDKGKPMAMVVAQEARVNIRNFPQTDSAEVSFTLKNGSGFDPANGFRRITGSFDGSEWKRPIPSLFQSRPKFLNAAKLAELDRDPSSFPSVADVMEQIAAANRSRNISIRVQKWWYATAVAAGQTGRGVTFLQIDPSGEKMQVTLYAEKSEIDPKASGDKCLTFSGLKPGGVTVETRTNGEIQSIFECDAADFVVVPDAFGGTDVTGQLRLHGNVKQKKQSLGQTAADSVTGAYPISGLTLDPSITQDDNVVVNKDGVVTAKFQMLEAAKNSPNNGMQKLARNAELLMGRLQQQIISERNSRGSFSVSCLGLVMLGAALGILLRGKNPLAVFVVGFVPAIFLVLLITAGRQLTEQGPQHTKAGITMIWAGNAVLLALVAGVYAKLLRK